MCRCQHEQQQQGAPLWHDLSQPHELAGSMNGLGVDDRQQNGLPSPGMAPLRSRCVCALSTVPAAGNAAQCLTWLAKQVPCHRRG